MPNQQAFSRGYRTNGKSLSCFVCLFAAIELCFRNIYIKHQDIPGAQMTCVSRVWQMQMGAKSQRVEHDFLALLFRNTWGTFF